MDNSQMYRLVRRSFALLFLFTGVNQALLLPADFMAIFHHMSLLQMPLTPGAQNSELHLVRYYGCHAGGRLIGVAIALWLGQQLYRGSDWVRRFLGEAGSVEKNPR